MKTAQELTDQIRAYDASVDGTRIQRAYDIASKAHSGQMRASGEPYISHPVAIADFLTSIKMDSASIITALLHDTVEDTSLSLEDISREFGEEIAFLVDGVTKLNKLEIMSESSKQAENFRKLVLAMAKDLRVLVVKLCDRRHNMQTIRYKKKAESRERIARETLEIYAPLAERIGMRRIKEELQDWCFKELHPAARESIINRLEFLRKQGLQEVERIQEKLLAVLQENNLSHAEVNGRQKQPYSIWRKMENKSINFDQLGDVIAFRVVVENTAECYQALGAIHNSFHTIPGRFKDYISTPKVNGYQSIHTEIIGPGQQRIEVQIRTREMHEIAEYGVAAHWSYKQGEAASREGVQFRWMRQLMEILKTTEDPEEFLEHTRMEMYHDQVFCFTPAGEIRALPQGSTPVDFAFSVHSRIGFHCVGAKVNGRIVPLKTVLQNGDQVHIITSKTQTPSPAWERFVVTGKARTEIRKYIRAQQRDEYITLGHALIAKTFKKEGKEFHERLLEKSLDALRMKSVDDVYAALGEGELSRNRVYELVTGLTLSPEKGKKKRGILPNFKRAKKNSDHTLPIKGLVPGMAIHFAGCCHPIPGDKIVGIVTTGKGITIHTLECESLENYSDTPERWIDVSWDTGGMDHSYIGRIKVSLSHEPGSIATLTQVISQEQGNINNLKITQRTIDFFDLLVDVEVRNDTHMSNIIAGLRAKDVIYSVERFVG